MSNTTNPQDDSDEWQRRSGQAQVTAAQAYGRLLVLAETRDSSQVRRVAGFLASIFDGQAFSARSVRIARNRHRDLGRHAGLSRRVARGQG